MTWRIRRYVPQGPAFQVIGAVPVWFDEHDTAYTDDPVVLEVVACAPELYEVTDLEEDARLALRERERLAEAASTASSAPETPAPPEADVPEPAPPPADDPPTRRGRRSGDA